MKGPALNGKTLRPCFVGLIGLVGTYCPAQQAPAVDAGRGATASPAAPMTPPPPDVGGLETVSVQAVGRGKLAAQAVDEAIKAAILQINGTTVDLSSKQFSGALAVAIGKTDLELKSSGFSELVSQHSRGAVTNFRVVSLVKSESEQQYIATVDANIARYRPPADSQIPKLVVAPLRVNTTGYQVGNGAIPAAQVSQQLHQELVNEFSQTGRFAVLDREFTDAILEELALVSSGEAPTIEFAKLGQALSADLIWVGTLQSLGYPRHVTQLETSDRPLVSYSGGATLSYRLINVATRQIVVSNSVNARIAPLGPTTLGLQVDAQEKLGEIESSLIGQIVPELLARMFPVTIVSRNGAAVVLSQGGKGIREHARYQVVLMGEELKDPQTGQSLGRAEQPCCVVEIERVTPSLSYGQLSDVVVNLDQAGAGGLQLRELLASAAVSNPPARSIGGRGSHGSSGVPATAQPVPSQPPFNDDANAKPKQDGNW